MPLRTAVLIPCYNEEATVADVVAMARNALPDAAVYVYDNNSTDKTAELAARAGAIVRAVPQQGKGSVVRRMFADIDADVYVMADGDMTYDLTAAPRLIDALVKGRKDMVIGTRKETEQAAYPLFHRFGNAFLTGLVRFLFGIRQTDMLSGLRVFSKRYVKTFSARSNGFEIETELNVFTAMNRLPFAEIETDYFARPEGSFRKLSTFKDGFKVVWMIARLIVSERPALFYGALAFLALVATFVLEFLTPDIVFPAGLWTFCGFWFFLFCAVLRDGQLKNKREAVRLAYLAHPFADGQD